MVINNKSPLHLKNMSDNENENNAITMDDTNEDIVDEELNESDVEYVGELDENNEFIPAADNNVEVDSTNLNLNEINPLNGANFSLDKYDCKKVQSHLSFTHNASIFGVDFSPNGQLVATASQEDKAFVWNSTTGELVFECCGHDESVTEAKFNHDGTYLATADMNGNVKVWKVANKTVLDEYTINSEITWLFWHPRGNILFAGCKDGDTYMWQLPMTQFKILFGSGSENVCASLLPDEKKCAIGYTDGGVVIFDLKTAKRIANYKNKHEMGGVTCMDTTSSDQHNIIAVGYELGGLALVNGKNGCEIAILRHDTTELKQFIESIKFGTGSASKILAAACDDEVQLWDFTHHTLRASMQFPGEKLARMVWSKNGCVFVAGVYHNNIYSLNGLSGELVAIYHDHNDSIMDLALSNNDQWLLSGSDDGFVHLFSVYSHS